MRKLAAVTVIVVATFAFSGTVDAAGNEQTGQTVGNCISDILYGHEPNMRDGAPGGPAEQAPGTKGGNVAAEPGWHLPCQGSEPGQAKGSGQVSSDPHGYQLLQLVVGVDHRPRRQLTRTLAGSVRCAWGGPVRPWS